MVRILLQRFWLTKKRNYHDTKAMTGALGNQDPVKMTMADAVCVTVTVLVVCHCHVTLSPCHVHSLSLSLLFFSLTSAVTVCE